MAETKLKIGTWNLCLGLSNKKDIVINYLKMKDIAICCLQETEVQQNFPTFSIPIIMSLNLKIVLIREEPEFIAELM